ncbi:transcriptional regulator FeaR [Pseudomonas sp. R5(2019)]|uniref:transcriptional regulator FeaR n=1 Tax=Pseudomonas sp. R5(2019) TaxID=2697566 RepID=UPI0014126D5F|nr:transcriptional regulator FeaR [Pseudomonas sp. R5(2019)]NBA97129.1 transcriptional regulator FeaR [Pseudomonas sp. R5(2019)]
MSIHSASLCQLDRWNATMQATCGRFDTELAYNRSLFIGEISNWSRGGLSWANLRTNAGVIRRNSLNADRDDDQDCFLISQRSGYAQVSKNGVSIQLAPGDMVLMDSVGSCEITPFGLIEHVSLGLSRNEVRKHLGQGVAAFGKISQNKACGRMLHLLMDQLCKETGDHHAAGSEGEALQTAFVSLLGSALERDDDERELPLNLNGANLRSYVQKVIDESLAQPGLTPVNLANRLNISVRHLYRLFEEQGDSVCRYIQRARLKRSADDLSNPILKTESITSIAYKWGFTDSAHFSRSFKKHFDLSPKDFRASSMQHAMAPAA